MSKFFINKLYNLYDYEIDLSQNCIVFIGENGLGKSTILKIFDCLIRHDFIELTRYQFESIKIINKTNKFELTYEQLFPDIDVIKKNYSVKREARSLKGYCEIFSYADSSIETNIIESVINTIIKNFGINNFCYCLACIFFEEEIDEEIVDTVENCISEEIERTLHYSLKVDWINEIKELMLQLSNCERLPVKSFLSSYISQNLILDLWETYEKSLNISEGILIDMVKRINFVGRYEKSIKYFDRDSISSLPEEELFDELPFPVDELPEFPPEEFNRKISPRKDFIREYYDIFDLSNNEKQNIIYRKESYNLYKYINIKGNNIDIQIHKCNFFLHKNHL